MCQEDPPTGEGVFWVWVPPAAYACLAGYREIREEIRGPPPLSGKASKEICKKIGAAQAQKQALWIRAAHAHAFRAKVQAWSKVISGRAPVPRRRRHPSSHADWLACSCHHGGEAPRAMPCDRRARRAVQVDVFRLPRIDSGGRGHGRVISRTSEKRGISSPKNQGAA